MIFESIQRINMLSPMLHWKHCQTLEKNNFFSYKAFWSCWKEMLTRMSNHCHFHCITPDVCHVILHKRITFSIPFRDALQDFVMSIGLRWLNEALRLSMGSLVKIVSRLLQNSNDIDEALLRPVCCAADNWFDCFGVWKRCIGCLYHSFK